MELKIASVQKAWSHFPRRACSILFPDCTSFYLSPLLVFLFCLLSAAIIVEMLWEAASRSASLPPAFLPFFSVPQQQH